MKKLTLVLSIAAAFVLAGCSSVELDESAKDGTTQTVYAQGAKGMGAAGSELGQASVYFAFNSYTVDHEYYPLIDRQVRTMIAHPTMRLRIEGNTDSRGSREYNLALGQKRSEAVKSLMQIRGVSPRRMEAVSFGREKPLAFGENEQAWAKNRRADFVNQ